MAKLSSNLPTAINPSSIKSKIDRIYKIEMMHLVNPESLVNSVK